MAGWAMAASLPTMAMAQTQPNMQPHREGSWEFSLGAGVLLVDGALRDFLGSGTPESRFANNATPSQVAPTLVARLGYNFTPHVGFSLSGGAAKGSGVTYLNPTAAITFTGNLNAKTSPFFIVGTELTRISGNNSRVTHSTWGAHAGVGIRSMLSENLALRLEGRMQFAGYREVPMRRNTTYSPVVTLGFSLFTGGREPPMAMMPQQTVRVDTVQVVRVDTVRLAALPLPTRNCAGGVAPPGVPVDANGCMVFSDSLLLEGVHFDFDKSDLTPTAAGILDRVAESMLAHPELYFEIAGHTDSIGTVDYNYLLSVRRAEAVRNYLIAHDVPAAHMTAAGYGEKSPTATNDTVEGRALNRRGVELRVRRP